MIRLAIEMSVQANAATWETLTKMIRTHSDKHADRERPRPKPRANPYYGIMMQQHYGNRRARSRSRQRRAGGGDKPTGTRQERDSTRASKNALKECWDFQDKGTCRFGKDCQYQHNPFLRGRGRSPDRGVGLSQDRGSGRLSERGRGGSPARSNSHGGTPYPSPGRSVRGRSP